MCEVTLALSSKLVPEAAIAFSLKCTVAVAPELSWVLVQAIVPLVAPIAGKVHEPKVLKVIPWKLKPAGIGLLRTTDWAKSGPLLVTVARKVSVVLRETLAAVSDMLRDRSEAITTFAMKPSELPLSAGMKASRVTG